MCNVIPMMKKVMYNQPVKDKQDLKPLDISNTTYETNEESTSELGVCIVLGVLKGKVDGMNDVITYISSLKNASKS